MANHRVILENRRSDPQRLDLLLLRKLREKEGLSELSRATLKQLFRDRRVRIQDKPASASALLAPGLHEIILLDWETADLTPPIALPSKRDAFLSTVPVVYEDQELLVLHKPSGIASIPHSPDETETAVGAALARHPRLAEVGRGSGAGALRGGLEPALLHRLDTGTSGLLAFAKSQEEFERLRALWKSREVVKHYRAVCTRGSRARENARERGPGAPAENTLPHFPQSLHWPLGHDPKSARKMIAWDGSGPRPTVRGKLMEAHTDILNVHEISPGPLGGMDIEVRIHTGVMHQIRCHLAALGWPILGDSLYRGEPSRRLWLHAWKLGLPLRRGTRLWIEAALPEDWPGQLV